MNWKFWKKEPHHPSPETIEAQMETEQAEERLKQVQRDDSRLNRLTARTDRLMIENNFAADIRRALGGAR